MRTLIGIFLMCVAGFLGFQDEIINQHWSRWLLGILVLFVGWYNASVGLLDFTETESDNLIGNKHRNNCFKYKKNH